MTTYRVDVTRDGKWWMISLPDLVTTFDGEPVVTQARHYDEIADQARDLVVLTADVAPSTVDLDIHVEVDGMDVADVATTIANARAALRADEAALAEQTEQIAQRLRDAGVDLRDIGDVVGVSFQRVSQITKDRRTRTN